MSPAGGSWGGESSSVNVAKVRCALSATVVIASRQPKESKEQSSVYSINEAPRAERSLVAVVRLERDRSKDFMIVSNPNKPKII